jgi:hypothetical protein
MVVKLDASVAETASTGQRGDRPPSTGQASRPSRLPRATLPYRRYLWGLSLTIVPVLTAAALFNALVDPARIYLKRTLNAGDFVNRLEAGYTGQYNVNERDLKVELAKRSTADCVVIGSSHVYQFTPIFLKQGDRRCKTWLNLSVPAASLEDQLVFTQLLTSRPTPPKVIFFELSHWTLTRDADTSYRDFPFYYSPRLYALGYQNTGLKLFWDSAVAQAKKLRELLSLTMLQSSIQEWPKFINHSVRFTKTPDLVKGMEDLFWVPDGSLLYAREYVAGAKSDVSPSTTIKYRTDRVRIEPEAWKLFLGNLEDLKRQGIQSVVILTPFHPYSFEGGNHAFGQRLIRFGEQVKSKLQAAGIPFTGGYRIAEVGCQDHEFYDMMHPRPICMARLLPDRKFSPAKIHHSKLP